MNTFKSTLITVTLMAFFGLCSESALAVNKIIYGEDNRFDLIDSPLPLFNDLARSTAAMVKKERLSSSEYDIVSPVKRMTKNIKPLKKALNLCNDEKFSDQPHLSHCSGFLVGKDILVTAGHCVSNRMANACEDFYWVFDYKVNDASDPFDINFPEENIYRCKEVLSSKFEPWNPGKTDYAIVKLDRPVSGRAPLKLRESGEVQVGEPLVLIGHPWGLPTKVSHNAEVLKNDGLTWFMANLDSFEGNSGSAVFNELTGEVEGILVRGKPDSVGQYLPEVGFCKTLNYCHEDGTNCNTHDRIDGEHVTKVSVFRDDLKKYLE